MGWRKGKKRMNGDDDATTAEGAAANKRGGGAKAARRDNAPKHVSYEKAIPTNVAYEEYYKPLVPEGEMELFLAALRRPLPLTFRVNATGKYADYVTAKLSSEFYAGLQVPDDCQAAAKGAAAHKATLEPPRKLDWYPGGSAWQLNTTRAELRSTPQLARVFDFVKTEDAAGSITRQEAVSMVPPLFLDVKPGHAVLDMCAAPGSKTFQLLEALHAGDGEPQGVVIANDVDMKRCGMLTHQTKRASSPTLLVLNHDAQHFPSLHGADDKDFRFDRVLADVPCTGDGTMRKNVDIWSKWHSAMGTSMHKLQLSVAVQCARQLATGGRMVYSTCSLNPVEDEAVVAQLLRRAEGKLELLDVSHELPSLKRTKGVTSWRVRDKVGNWYTTFDQEDAATVSRPANIIQSQFPPSTEELASGRFPLDRCMRFFPHHADTGGFFVAVLQKTGELPLEMHPRRGALRAIRKEAEAEAWAAGEAAAAAGKAAEAAETKTAAAADAAAGIADGAKVVEGAAAEAAATATEDGVKVEWKGKGKEANADKKGKGKGPSTVDPIVPMRNAEVLDSIERFYGLDPGSAFKFRTQLTARSADAFPKRLSYLSSALATVMDAGKSQRLTVVSAGVRVFERLGEKQASDPELKCAYRISQDGLATVIPHLTKQMLTLPFEEYVRLLTRRNMPFKSDSSDVALSIWSDATRTTLEKMQLGCAVVMPDLTGATYPGASASKPSDLAIVCWRGKASLSLMVSKPESAQMLERVGVDSVAVLKAAAAEQKAFEATKASDDATTVPP